MPYKVWQKYQKIFLIQIQIHQDLHSLSWLIGLQRLNECGLMAQYIYQDSKLLASLMQWYIPFLPCRSGAEIKCAVHDALPKRSINQFKLVQESRQLVLRATVLIYILWLKAHCNPIQHKKNQLPQLAYLKQIQLQKSKKIRIASKKWQKYVKKRKKIRIASKKVAKTVSL